MSYEVQHAPENIPSREDEFLKKVQLLRGIYNEAITNFDTSSTESEVTLKPKIWQVLKRRVKNPQHKTQKTEGNITKFGEQVPCALTLKYIPDVIAERPNGELNIAIGHVTLTIDNSTDSTHLLLCRSTLNTQSGKNTHLTYPTTNELSSFHEALQTFTPVEQQTSL